MLIRLIEIAIFASAFVGGFLILRKAWKRADLQETAQEKLEKIANEKELAAKVISVNTRQVKSNRKKIRDFDKL